jgi:sporulation protein YunB
MPYYRGRFRKKNMKRRVYFFIFFVFTAVAGLYVIFNIELLPVLRTTAVNKAKVAATNTINDAVGAVLKQDDVNYDKLISFEKDASGNITAIKADTFQINLLKYDITKEVVKELSEVGGSEIKIPVGTVIGGQIFTGLGPNINIRFQPVGNINSEITSTFTSVGINQTRQQIMLDIKADLTVIVATYNISTQVESNFIIADSVIVGGVPGTYVTVDGTDGTIGKIISGSQSSK